MTNNTQASQQVPSGMTVAEALAFHQKKYELGMKALAVRQKQLAEESNNLVDIQRTINVLNKVLTKGTNG